MPSFEEYENPISVLETEGRDNSEGPVRREALPWGPSCGTCGSEKNGNEARPLVQHYLVRVFKILPAQSANMLILTEFFKSVILSRHC